ncbi:Ferredoxin [Anaerovibrio sp. JC8]|uniref:EFR1 family ferrodoxin n=1 Tax=Anaerovibrio sp. JC8 TaxID=1240085 RepID=UPI000A0BE3DD|nr:EFR1 family ferrodoxin [Anaerovibrio sp. JC8]ORT99944.1 Ferredoxin [Anaerovibrio sp. JC8]
MIIYYYSSTGNSLYVARFLQERLPDVELRSIPEELNSGIFEVQADKVGFVFPMHYLSLPLQVEEFLEKVSFKESPYLFAIATCGVPYWGRPFLDMNAILAKKRRQLHGAWFLRLVSNYLPYRDTAAEWRISIRAWLAERKLKGIAKAIAQNGHHDTWQVLRDMCQRICPKGNIVRPDGHPVWQHNCVECLGCLHICPVEAIDYAGVTKGRRRYRHKDIQPKELLHDFKGEIDP